MQHVLAVEPNSRRYIMKIRSGFSITTIEGKSVISVTDTTSIEFNGIIILNNVGLEIWNILRTDHSYEDIIEQLSSQYNVSVEVLKKDVDSFLNKISFAIEK